MPNQVGEKHNRAAEHRDDDHFAAGKVTLDHLRHFTNSPGKLLLRNEYAFDILEPTDINMRGFSDLSILAHIRGVTNCAGLGQRPREIGLVVPFLRESKSEWQKQVQR